MEAIALARRILPQAGEMVPSTTRAVAVVESQVAEEEIVEPGQEKVVGAALRRVADRGPLVVEIARIRKIVAAMLGAAGMINLASDAVVAIVLPMRSATGSAQVTVTPLPRGLQVVQVEPNVTNVLAASYSLSRARRIYTNVNPKGRRRAGVSSRKTRTYVEIAIIVAREAFVTPMRTNAFLYILRKKTPQQRAIRASSTRFITVFVQG